jgi:LysR family transcriptional regulator, low CO2-responsive transcriptional regulator
MNLRQLETFVKIGQLKSFTRAGEELRLTQPTVSKQMVDLERFFDIKLIDRTKRSLALTRAGELLFKYAKDFLALQEETVSAIAAFKGLRRGSIRIGASNIPGGYILPPILKRYREQHEGIQLALTISDTKAILDRVEQGELDIGFVGAKDEHRKLLYHSFLDDLIVMVAPSAYPGSITMEELKRYPLIVREVGSGTRQSFETALKRRGFGTTDFNVAAELGDTQAVKEAVKEGMGLAYLSRRAISEELASKVLKVLTVEGVPAVKRSFYAVLKKGRSQTPQVEALLKTIQEWRKNEKVRLVSD